MRLSLSFHSKSLLSCGGCAQHEGNGSTRLLYSVIAQYTCTARRTPSKLLANPQEPRRDRGLHEGGKTARPLEPATNATTLPGPPHLARRHVGLEDSQVLAVHIKQPRCTGNHRRNQHEERAQTPDSLAISDNRGDLTAWATSDSLAAGAACKPNTHKATRQEQGRRGEEGTGGIPGSREESDEGPGIPIFSIPSPSRRLMPGPTSPCPTGIMGRPAMAIPARPGGGGPKGPGWPHGCARGGPKGVPAATAPGTGNGVPPTPTTTPFACAPAAAAPPSPCAPPCPALAEPGTPPCAPSPVLSCAHERRGNSPGCQYRELAGARAWGHTWAAQE